MKPTLEYEVNFRCVTHLYVLIISELLPQRIFATTKFLVKHTTTYLVIQLIF